MNVAQAMSVTQMMAVTFWTRPLACALFCSVLLASASQAAQPRFARLGSFEGPVEVQLDPAEPWRPALQNLPLPESTRIRTGPAAKLEIELDDTSVFRMAGEGLAELSDYTRLSGGQRITVISLDHGLAYFTGEPGPGNVIHLLIPGAQATLKQGSRIRLQALDTSSEIAIIEGATRFTIPSAEMELHGGQSARVSFPEAANFSLSREITPFDTDTWNEQLDKAEASAPPGRLDLDRSGKWLQVEDYGTVWQPAPQAGWAPFRQGRWIWFQSTGFTWVGAEAWGWKPYHEGRWLQHPDLGWIWQPGAKDAAFAPGAVYWTRAANLAAWGALAPGEQWNGAGTPRQFAAFNITGGTLAAGTREILPVAQDSLPKDLLKTLQFTAALPSPAFPASRLTVVRDNLRTHPVTAVDVSPMVPAEITEAAPPEPAPERPRPVVREAALIATDPVIAPDPVASDAPPVPDVPGVIIVDRKRQHKISVPAAPSIANAIELTGGGVTAAAPLYQKWFGDYKLVQIKYQGLAFDGRLRGFADYALDFAAVDSPGLDPRHADTGLAPLYFPVAVGAVVPVYNFPFPTEPLRLTPELLAAIFLGHVRYWNDARLVAANPHVTLPPMEIVVIRRSDACTTNYILNDFLSAANPAWKAKFGVSTTLDWAVPGGLTGLGNEGVIKTLQNTPYAITYVDGSYAAAKHLTAALVRNHSGHFVAANPDNLAAAAASVIDAIPHDFRISIANSSAADAYPIASFTYLLTPRHIADDHKRTALTEMLHWVLTTGQKYPASFGFAPLPADLVRKERRQISTVK